MNPQDRIQGFSATELRRLHDEARRRARQLRNEAIDEFWRGVRAVLWAQLSSAQRAATRLAHRLQRHHQLRAATPADRAST
jgi:hypothetical protein